MRGPVIQPPSIACWSATSAKSEEPTLRTVVKPASSVVLAFGDADRGPEIVGIFEALIAADFGQAGQVYVHVDEAGKQGLARQIDMLRAGRILDRRGIDDRLHMPIVADEDRRMVDVAAVNNVE